jgi:hypothetical protein
MSADLARLRGLARLLDSAIRLPGGYRIGLDGIIGLIPGVGDAVTAAAAAYIVVQAAQMGATTSTLIRMMLNVLLEVLVGVVPVVGDLFDFAWKANNRNIELLERQPQRLTGTGAARQRLTKATLALIAAFLLLLVLLFVGFAWLLLQLSESLVAG